MKKIIIAALAAAAISTASAATYKVDEYHANARFSIDHFNTSTNVGGFYGLTGSVEFDQAKRDGKIDITIPVANLQSGSQHFTDHLKSADIFDAAQYPNIRFVSTKFNFNGKKLVSVDGNLTMHGKTAPVKLTEVCGGDFSTTIDRTKWGMDYLVNVGMTKSVRIDIQIEAAKQ